jgi:hypothetical protein
MLARIAQLKVDMHLDLNLESEGRKRDLERFKVIKNIYASTIPDQWVLALSSNRGWVLRRQKKGNLHFCELRGT